MYHVGLCVLNVLFNLFPQGKGHCSERTGGGVHARRDYWSQEPSSVQGSFEGLRVSLGEGQCDGTEPPWLKVAWCLYGKRLCLPETKAFRWAMQTLGTLAAGGGGGTHPEGKVISEAGTEPECQLGGVSRPRAPP